MLTIRRMAPQGYFCDCPQSPGSSVGENMNKAWSEENKAMQALLKKEATFSQGVARLLALRESLFAEILRMEEELPREGF